MKTYLNATGQTQTVRVWTDPRHYEQGHQCDGSCSHTDMTIQPGSTLVFDNAESNGSDIIGACASAAMQEVA